MIGTMKFYRHLYVSDSIRNLEKVKWKLRHNAGQITIYIIAAVDMVVALTEKVAAETGGADIKKYILDHR